MVMVGLCCLGAMLTTTPSVEAQDGPIRFARLGVQEGLPDSHVHNVHQDRDGFLWFSTRDGLARFDGYDFTVFRHDPFDLQTIHGNWVQQIFEDRDGNLWIPLGVGGIDLYQRRQQTFRHVADRLTGPTGSSDTNSTALLASSGDLWFGTLSNGLFSWRAEEAALVPIATGQLLSARISTLLEDRHGRIWVGSCGGVDVFDPASPEAPLLRFPTVSEGDPRAMPGNSPTCIRNFYEDSLGEVWVGTQGMGALRLRADATETAGQTLQGEWVSGPLADIETPIGLQVRNILGTADGTIWFSSNDRGLSAYRPSSQTYRGYPSRAGDLGSPGSNNINILFVDRQDRLWIGTFDAGLDLYDADQERFLHFRNDPLDPYSLSGDNIASIYEDTTGNLWVGTFGEGANVYSPYRWKFTHYPPRRAGVEGTSGRVITGMAQGADETIWIGSFDGGLDAFDPRTERFTAIPLSPLGNPARVTSLVVDENDHLWVGNADGLLQRLDEASPPRFSVFDVLQLQATGGRDSLSALAKGTRCLWIGTGNNGFLRYDLITGQTRRYQLDPGQLPQNVPVWSLLEDHLGQVWIGTPSFGLYRFDPDRETFTIYRGTTRNPGELDNRTIKSLFEDRSGRLWIGTFSGGLNLFDRQQEQFVPWTVHQGLPSNKIEAIREGQDGELWLSTNRGLVSLLPGQQTTRIYDRADGLQHDEFQQGAAVAASNGELYFGGRNGFNRFRPSTIEDNPNVPPVVITAFRKFGQKVHFAEPLQDMDDIVLAHHENVISFEFAALDFAHPKKNRYRYRLQGFDPAWVEVGNPRLATYTNLDPGHYVFSVQGSNNDGVWNVQGATLRLIIVPPFWLRWWFFLLEGAIFVGLLTMAFRAQKRRLERRQRDELRRQDHRRKTEELDFARRVQLSMLPDADLSRPRFEAVGRMVTASEVGGDYFDYFDLGNSRHCLALGDAIGHGSAAGLVVGMVKAGLHQALESTADRPPANVLGALNRTLHASLTDRRSGMGLTLLVLDEETLEAQLASTAMPYPYLYRRASRTLQNLELGGFPLGLGPMVKARQLSLTLAPGDVLIMISDGVVERRDRRGTIWGYGSLEKTLQDLCAASTDASELASRLISINHRWADDLEPEDDLTVVVVCIKER